VVIAGWTTANPTIYRAGLAFQSLFPKSHRTTGVLLAGLVATVAGAFPNLSAQLLDFVGTYGMILGPMGAIIFVNHYFAKRLGFYEDAAEVTGSRFNLAVLLAWLIPAVPGLWLILSQGVFAAYLVIPAWIASAILYVILGKIMFPNKSQA
jgi:NCS1 family nucleobase:cation symporter-1